MTSVTVAQIISVFLVAGHITERKNYCSQFISQKSFVFRVFPYRQGIFFLFLISSPNVARLSLAGLSIAVRYTGYSIFKDGSVPPLFI